MHLSLFDLIVQWLDDNQYEINIERYGGYEPDFYLIFIITKHNSNNYITQRGIMVLENKVQIPDIHSAGIVEIFAHDNAIFDKLKNYLDAPKIWTYVSPNSHTYA